MGSFGAAGFDDSHGARDFLLEDDDEDLFDDSGRSFFSTLQKRALNVSGVVVKGSFTWAGRWLAS